MKVYNHNDIREWYIATYPNDELGKEIRQGLTWRRLWAHLLANDDIYSVLGAGDSIIRERVFGELADAMGVDYDVVYYVWLEEPQTALQSLIKGKI